MYSRNPELELPHGLAIENKIHTFIEVGMEKDLVDAYILSNYIPHEDDPLDLRSNSTLFALFPKGRYAKEPRIVTISDDTGKSQYYTKVLKLRLKEEKDMKSYLEEAEKIEELIGTTHFPFAVLGFGKTRSTMKRVTGLFVFAGVSPVVGLQKIQNTLRQQIFN